VLRRISFLTCLQIVSMTALLPAAFLTYPTAKHPLYWWLGIGLCLGFILFLRWIPRLLIVPLLIGGLAFLSIAQFHRVTLAAFLAGLVLAAAHVVVPLIVTRHYQDKYPEEDDIAEGGLKAPSTT
jgi:hypothetical protein